MNKNNECEIVRDLAIPFLEKLVNKGSEEFVKEHLETCNECKKYYKNINSQTNIENISKNDTDNIVINQFKKINKHINFLKTSLITIMIIIVIICSVLFIKHQKLSNIVNAACSKIEDLKELDNYKLTIKTIQKNLKNNNKNDNWEYIQNYYYKDGKYKMEDSSNSVEFYSDNSKDTINVFHDLKQIDYLKPGRFWEVNKDSEIQGMFEIVKYKEVLSSIYSLVFSTREEIYNGIDCYVIRSGNNDSYRDIWIDKNTLMMVRLVNEEYQSFYREQIYTFYENVVTDEDVDVEVLKTEKYNDYTKNDTSLKVYD